jgi:hypothetical protein
MVAFPEKTMSVRTSTLIAAIGSIALLLFPTDGSAQADGSGPVGAGSPAPEQRPVTPPIPSTPNPATARARVGRWFELQNATLNLRYRYIDTSAGVITTNHLQHREGVRARVKLDTSAKYTLNFGLFTGVRFTSGWDNTGWGINDAQSNFAFKALHVAAIPIAGVEAQYGGLYIIKGESTEVTTFDEDGYVIGQRVSVKRPKQFYLNEISATVGYLATDPREIPISKRTKYLNDTPNYRHFLVDKKVGQRAGISTDFTYAAGAKTWREAVNLKTPELRVVDTVIFETYQRINRNPDQGFALTLDKVLDKKLSVNWGYASIDREYGVLNADRFQIGNRVFAMVIYNISTEFLASAFITRAVGNDIAVPQRTLSNIVFTYNALPALKRTGLF